MENINIKNYLSEANESLIETLNENNLLYIVAGCSCGKSYWIKNYLMKNYKTLNVNFLNVLNLQNFSESFMQGESGAKLLDGQYSATINVQNLSRVSVLFDVLVIDEIQKIRDCNYRGCVNEIPEVIKKYKEAGKKVIILTGTPIEGLSFIDELGFKKVGINKTELSEKDRYEITFVQGLNKSNFNRVVENELIFGSEGLIVIADERRDCLRKYLSRGGYEFEGIRTDDKLINGTRLNKLVKDSELLGEDENGMVFLSTGVMIEGLNINDNKKIEVITWMNEIDTPMNIIQAAGRMRNQTKRIIIGFKDESDFNYQTLRLVRKNITDSELLNNIESALTSRFNNWGDWENYFKTYTPECKITRTTIEHYSEAENLNEKFTKTKTDWKSWIKELGNYEKALVMKRIEGEEEGFKFEDAPNGKTIWAYTTNPIKAKSLYQLFSVGYDMEKLDEKEINLCAEVIKPANTLTYAIKTAKYDKESIFKKFSYECLVDKIKQNTFSKNEWDGLINDTFEYEYVIDGEKVDVSDPKVAARYMKDKKKMIDIPTEIVHHFKTTIINIVAKNLGETLMDEAKRKMNEEGVGFFEALNGVDINADLRKDLDNYKAYKEAVKKSLKGSNKGKSVSYKYELISDSSIKFKTRDEAYEYYINNNLGNRSLKAFVDKGIINNYFKRIK